MKSRMWFVAFGLVSAPEATSRTQEPAGLRCEVAISPSDTEFGTFANIAPGANGRFAWTDGRSRQFSIRDSRGKVRVVGRPGSGPGEFQDVGGMDWIGDSLWVADGRLPRVQMFSDTGHLIRVITTVRPAAWGAVGGDSLAGFGNVPLGRDVPFAVLSSYEGGSSVDTVAVFPLIPAERFPLPPQMALNQQPLLPETVVGWSPNHLRFCVARQDSESVQVRCVDRRGAPVVNRSIRLEPRPVTDAVYDGVVKTWSRDPARTEAAMRDLIRRPRYLPLVLDVRVDNEGGIWLRRSHDSESSAVWTQIRRDGSVGVTLTLPVGYRLLRVDAQTLWTTSSDNDGLQTVHRCVVR